MKMLSPLIYIRNKRKVFASINAIMIAVIFLYILYSFIQSMLDFQTRITVDTYQNMSIVSNNEKKPIDSSIIDDISNNQDVDKVIPLYGVYGLRYSIPGIIDNSRVFSINKDDIYYLMDKQGIKLIEGRLPDANSKEILVNKNIAKNKNVVIGDKVGNSINKYDNLDGEYEVVGIIDSKSIISIIFNDSEESSSRILIFPVNGELNSMNKYLNSIDDDNLTVNTLDSAKKVFKDTSGSIKIIDIIAIISVVVMVVTVGSSKFAQYFNRKEELGILNAIGYSKYTILKRTFKEITIVNMLGVLIGFLIGFLLSILISKTLWEPNGAVGNLITTKGIIVSLFVPLFTVLFTIIPINNLINKLDPIKMIEKN